MHINMRESFDNQVSEHTQKRQLHDTVLVYVCRTGVQQTQFKHGACHQDQPRLYPRVNETLSNKKVTLTSASAWVVLQRSAYKQPAIPGAMKQQKQPSS